MQPGERVAIRITNRQRDLILEHTFLDGDLEKRIRAASADAFGVVVHLDLDDLDELLGFVAAEANHSKHPRIARQLFALFERLKHLEDSRTDEDIPASCSLLPAPSRRPRTTQKQGQYLSSIHYYTKIHAEPPAEADLQRYFKVSAPAVHRMIVALEEQGLIARTAGKARSIRLLVSRDEIPDLE
jgi:repressor LexA